MAGWWRITGIAALAAACAASGLIVTTADARAATVAAKPTWKIQPSPNFTRPGGEIHSISCSAAEACTAVGTYISTAGLNVTLAERWNGSSWTRQATPNPSSDVSILVSPVLQGVSCPSASFCEAVGATSVGEFDPSQTVLADLWNGRSWRAQPVPLPVGATSASLNAVSCASAKVCIAVGSYVDTSGQWALAERWNGSSWHLQRTPVPAGSRVGLQGVSCPTTTQCEAVGSYNATSSGTDVGLGEAWDGSSWELQAMPASALVTALSCASATFCEAVGANVVADWNGTSWTSQAAPTLASATLNAVSCVSPVSCEAVGWNAGLTLAARWNGTSWKLQRTKNPARGTPSSSTFDGFYAVACVGAANCEAGGYFFRDDSSFTELDRRALAEVWNGASWQIQGVAEPQGGTTNVLDAVSCASATFCEAVGWRFDTSEDQAGLAEVWNGTRWRFQKVPSPAQFDGLRLVLDGVSCVSARFCVAVGDSFSSSNALIWNGKTWTAQVVPHPDHLASVSCTSPSFCVAVGQGGAVMWDGHAWSTLPTDITFSYYSVSCVSAHFCEATGDPLTGSRGYAEIWNGTSWSRQATPVPAGAANVVLGSVSCAAAYSCEAAGSYENLNLSTSVMLAERWNGTVWTIQHPPSPKASTSAALTGVWCTSANFCAAVGWANTTLSTLALVWNGISWTLRATATLPASADGSFSGVSCTPSHTCTGVGSLGYRTRSYSASTLVESGN